MQTITECSIHTCITLTLGNFVYLCFIKATPMNSKKRLKHNSEHALNYCFTSESK